MYEARYGLNEEIEARLRILLELNRYEAKAYLTLVKMGSMKAVELAEFSGIPRGRIYDVLRSLEAKGLVNRRDHFYEAVNPRRALARIGQRKLVEALDAMRRIEELAEELENSYKTGGMREEVRLIYGLKESLAAALSSITQCRGPVYFVAFKASEKSLEYWDLLSPLIDRLPSNVRVLVPSTQRPPRQALEALLEKGIEVRSSPAAVLDMMAACDTVIIGLPSLHHDVVSVFIRHPAFASGLASRLEEMWRNAAPVK